MLTNKGATDRTEPTTAAKRRFRKKRALEARREREGQLPSAHAQRQSTSAPTMPTAGKAAGKKKAAATSPTALQPKPPDASAASLNEVEKKTSPDAEKKVFSNMPAAGKVAAKNKAAVASATASKPKPTNAPSAGLNEVESKTSPDAEKKVFSTMPTAGKVAAKNKAAVTSPTASKHKPTNAPSAGHNEVENKTSPDAEKKVFSTMPAAGKVAAKNKAAVTSPTASKLKPTDAPSSRLNEVECKTSPDAEEKVFSTMPAAGKVAAKNKAAVTSPTASKLKPTDAPSSRLNEVESKTSPDAEKKVFSTMPAAGKVAAKNKAAVTSPTASKLKPTDAPSSRLNEYESKISTDAEKKLLLNTSNKTIVNNKPTQKNVPLIDQIAEKTSAGTDEVDRTGGAHIESLEADKSREQVKAEREAKKQAKLAKKKNATHLPDSAADSVQQATHNVPTVQAPAEEMAKSKADVRAERRAKQEAQRAAKMAASLPPAPVALNPPPKEIVKSKTSKVTAEVRVKSRLTPPLSSHRVNWFQHLYTERGSSPVHTPINTREVHPAVVRLAVQLSSRVVAGANARCVALLHALKQVVSDYMLPARTEFSRGLETQLATALEFVFRARPASASMTNAVKHLRWHLTQLPNNIDEFDAKHRINEAIDTYIRDQIEVAGEAISMAVRGKISHGDYILTYGSSSLVEKILVEAHEQKLQFRVVVVGSRTRAHGRNMLRRLVARGVTAHYAHISALSFLMRTTDKVVVGAASLLGNGWVVAHAGTAQVALVARAFNVPVLVCCETHKFSERVQTDAFVCNELGEPEQLIEMEQEATCPLAAWRSLAALTPLDLTYDVTPPGLVTAVVTELAVLPCTSAPVVLRFKLSEYGL